ncbi:MAG: hypothetical protein E7019_06495 [Alphaproteobacteria bacterium]|nr:hypothetical protein [Alphaproteobacteria bacterium]
MSKKIDELRGVGTEERKERESFPETDLLKRCTRFKSSSDGKEVQLLDNNNERLGVVSIIDNEHQNLVLADGTIIVGRYQFSKSAGENVWSIYDTNNMGNSKMRITDEERLKSLKQLFGGIRRTSELAKRYGREMTETRMRSGTYKSKG